MGFLRDIRLMTLLMVLLIVLILGMIGFAFYQGYLINRYTVTNVYNYGVFVDDIHLGGMTRYEAEETVLSHYKLELGCLQLALQFEDELVTFRDLDIVPEASIQDTLDQAYLLGRVGTPTERLGAIQKLPNEPVYMYTSKELKYDTLQSKIETLFDEKMKPAKNASVVGFDPHATKEEHRFTFSYEVKGMVPQFDVAWKQIVDEIENRYCSVVLVEYDELSPAVTVEDLKQNNRKIDASTTELRNDDHYHHNVLLACDAISGYTLGPEEIFDFDAVVGEITEKRGYEKALDGFNKYRLGAGVNQVASTLYQAAIEAGMSIQERHAHKSIVPYTGGGRDANVDDEEHNLVFKNPHETPVYIIMWSDDVHDTLKAEIYGAPLPDGLIIDLVVERVEEFEAEEGIQLVPSEHLAQGEIQSVSAIKGAICHSYRVYKNKNGEEIKRELLYEDYYDPIHERLFYHHGDPPPTP